MKNIHPLSAKFVSLLSVGFVLAASVAEAQTQTFYYENAGSGANAAASGGTYGGTLSSVGFNVDYYDHKTNATLLDNGAVSSRPAGGLNGAYDINITSSLAAPAGFTLQSVTIYLFAESINPDGSPVGFSVYDAVNGGGGFVQTLSLTGPTGEDKYFSFTVTGDQFLNGISITSTGLGGTALLNVASELSTVNGGNRTPGFSATFVAVPEPSVVMLGALGFLALLRRRRC